MPKLSGLEVVENAREHGYKGKFIILSGFSDFKFAQTAIRLGVDNYITKPIDEDELEEAVKRIGMQIKSEKENVSHNEHYREKAKKELFLRAKAFLTMYCIILTTIMRQISSLKSLLRCSATTVHTLARYLTRMSARALIHMSIR